MSQLHRTQTATGSVRARQPLPPAGPAWFGSVMGTGILSTLSHTARPDALAGPAEVLARVLLVAGWVALAGLTAGFLLRVSRRHSIWTASWRDPGQVPLWGMVSMGMLAIGGASAAVLPAWVPGWTTAARTADLALWVLGTVLGLLTAFGFTAMLVRTDLGTPTTVWGLAVVPPMVSATVGAGLVDQLPSPGLRLILVVGLVACFFLGLFVAAIVFGVCYLHHWRVEPLPLAASTTAWIPLGILGQSTAAAQSISARADLLVAPGVAGAVPGLAVAYGTVALTAGVPLAGWALAVTVRGFRGRMPFVPGWWSLTFPIGTLSLGCYLLGSSTGCGALTVAGQLCWLVLCGTWTFCTISTVRAVRRQLAGSTARAVGRQGATG